MAWLAPLLVSWGLFCLSPKWHQQITLSKLTCEFNVTGNINYDRSRDKIDLLYILMTFYFSEVGWLYFCFHLNGPVLFRLLFLCMYLKLHICQNLCNMTLCLNLKRHSNTVPLKVSIKLFLFVPIYIRVENSDVN